MLDFVHVTVYEQTTPARRAPAVLLPDWALAAKGGKVGPAALFQVLAEVMEGIAAVAMLARARGELGGPCDRIAQALSIREGAKFSLLVLTLLLFPSAVFFGNLYRLVRFRSSLPFGGIIVDGLVHSRLFCPTKR